ncbi:hypothetical protein QWY82_09680 [Simiduia curdlanivorans]|uniref:Uncharacterized protein n=1 Tax=Simiduia curdlanivorans TaxID=1492769 RepID=A0ABV8V745_9GAMM|nr:hypothetical protein [Simiduia curdlanivorans]MDN3639077.1 hypothetical protein [Simiduia curdlanivorans]
MKNGDRILPIIMVIAAFVFVALSVFISSQRALTSLENTLLQAFGLGLGLIGSFMFGKQSAKEAAKEIIKPHARSAFRRLISLYESLSRVGFAIENCHSSPESQSQTMAKLEAIVIEQLSTADDALEDWNDIVPEEVSELKARLERSRINGRNNEQAN